MPQEPHANETLGKNAPIRQSILWSFLLLFFSIAAFHCLRPLRDMLGISLGVENLPFLFVGSFILLIPVLWIGNLIQARVPANSFLGGLLSFLLIHLLFFYVWYFYVPETPIVAIGFFLWFGVFNLFTISKTWTFISDVCNSRADRENFGRIAAGGTLGGLIGLLFVSGISHFGQIELVFMASIALLLMAMFAHRKLGKLQKALDAASPTFTQRATLFKELKKYSFKELRTSIFFRKMMCFILLYTGISTALYFLLMDSVALVFEGEAARLQYFANVELGIHMMAFVGQSVFSKKLLRMYGLKTAFVLWPLCLVCAFLIFYKSWSLIHIAALYAFFKTGNFILVRPSREILFGASSRRTKYFMKSIVDTLVYRAGDAISGGLFFLLTGFGFTLKNISVFISPLAFLWGIFGYQLIKKENEKS